MKPEPKNVLKRRDFLKSSLTAGGGVLTGLIPSISPLHPKEQEPNLVIKAQEGKDAVSRYISLPKSGASIKGMGEDFNADLFTGTEQINIPIPLTPGRSKFAPDLKLSYSISNGNDLFGMSWGLSLGKIQRKTQNRIPTYDEADTFMLNGNELVPGKNKASELDGYRIQRYFPRYERDFSRIEYWEKINGQHPENLNKGFWKVVSKENITQIFGLSKQAATIHPENPSHIFSWSLELSYDGKGNCIYYAYFKGNDTGGDYFFDTRPYIERIQYNILESVPFHRTDQLISFLSTEGNNKKFFSILNFDYGQYEETDGQDRIVSEGIISSKKSIQKRSDPVISFRSGFGIKTDLLCQRILLLHRVSQADTPQLVKSLDFEYERLGHNGVFLLKSLIKRGYAPSKTNNMKYSEDYVAQRFKGVKSTFFDIACFPPLEFTYQVYQIPTSKDLNSFRKNGGGIEPSRSLSDANYAMLDLFGRGLPDILETSDNRYYYWENKGNGAFASRKELPAAPYRLKFSNEGVGLGEMNGDAGPDILAIQNNKLGYCAHQWSLTDNKAVTGWKKYETFPVQPGIRFKMNDKNLKFLDLTGDGKLDALLSGPGSFTFFKCDGENGFVKVRYIPRSESGLDKFPNVRFNSPQVHLADMTGDGLMDIVEISGQKVHYWPNKGYGNFGHRMVMEGSLSPSSSLDDIENVYFIDLDGSGPSDIIHIGRNFIDFWFNQSGKWWSKRNVINRMPNRTGPVKLLDLYGNGITGVLWSNGTGFSNNYFLPLTTSKPGLMKEIRNNMGMKIKYSYKPSTHLQLDYEKGSKSWIGRVPFPVYVLESVERIDEINQSNLLSKFYYAHGYYDEEEKEFVGFGFVEQQDSESLENYTFKESKEAFQKKQFQDPSITKNWFHTGIQDWDKTATEKFKTEYFQDDPASFKLPHAIFDQTFNDSTTKKEASRTLKGSLLRKEVYGNDKPNKAGIPYLVEDFQYSIKQIQAKESKSKAVFYKYETQKLGHTYERNSVDPRINHNLTLKIDTFGNKLESAEVYYPQRNNQRKGFFDQEKYLIKYNIHRYGQKTDSTIGYRHSVLLEEREYEFNSASSLGTYILSRDDLLAFWEEASEIPYENDFSANLKQKKLIGGTRNIFWNDDVTSILPFGNIEELALPHSRRDIAFTAGLLKKVYSNKIDSNILNEAGYIYSDGFWWRPSGHTVNGEKYFDPNKFYLEVRNTDPFGNTYQLNYDPLNLVVQELIDPLNNMTQASVDYRTLQIKEVVDVNGNRIEVAFDPLANVVAIAVKGKSGQSVGDSLDGISTYLDKNRLIRHFEDPFSGASALIQSSSKRIVYNFWSIYFASQRNNGVRSNPDIFPVSIHTMESEKHFSDRQSNETVPIKHTFQYLDGFRRPILTKIKADDTKWVGTGYIVYNNKGNEVKKYEPFYSNVHGFEISPQGVSPEYYYDPLSRIYKTHFPDGSLSRTSRTAWQEMKFDRNDTVNDSGSNWAQKMQSSGNPTQLRALQLTKLHANTPITSHLDVKGRIFLVEEDNGNLGKYTTQTVWDTKNKKLAIIDDKKDKVVANIFDLLARPIVKNFKDKGKNIEFPDAQNQIAYRWDARDWRTHYEYDKLQRVTHTRVKCLHFRKNW